MRRGIIAIFVLGGVLGSTGVSRADGAESLAEGLKAVEVSIQTLETAEARKSLDALLKAHEDTEQARAQREKIVMLMAHVVFLETHERPDAKDLVSGTLKAYDWDTGEIEIDYTPETAGDLNKDNAGYGFPAEFTGPFTITIEGAKFTRGVNPRCTFGHQEDEGGRDEFWEILFGAPQFTRNGRKQFYESVARRFVDDEEEDRERGRSSSPAKNGEAYKAIVEVDKHRCNVTLCGKKLVKMKKRKDLFGWTWVRFPKWDKLSYEGPIDPRWMRTRAFNKLATSSYAAFSKDFNPAGHLPAWLFE